MMTEKDLRALSDGPDPKRSALRRVLSKLALRQPGALVLLEDDEIQALIDDVARHPDDYMNARTVMSPVKARV
jgi:hypothetical protein